MGLGFLYSFFRASDVLIQVLIGEFAVANIKDIDWNALAFKSLVINKDKKMVL